jgi:hypothetical protein
MRTFVVIIISSSNIFFLTKNNKKKFEIFASNEDEDKLTSFAQFPWPPIDAGLSISTFFLLFSRDG